LHPLSHLREGISMSKKKIIILRISAIAFIVLFGLIVGHIAVRKYLFLLTIRQNERIHDVGNLIKSTILPEDERRLEMHYDIDGDGIDESISVNDSSFGNALCIYLSKDNSTLSHSWGLPRINAVGIYDLDHDGTNDFWYYVPGDQYIGILWNDGDNLLTGKQIIRVWPQTITNIKSQLEKSRVKDNET
jgi:hypothetical protein